MLLTGDSVAEVVEETVGEAVAMPAVGTGVGPVATLREKLQLKVMRNIINKDAMVYHLFFMGSSLKKNWLESLVFRP
jgi:hypothetical protein